MNIKPTYEELEQGVKVLQKEVVELQVAEEKLRQTERELRSRNLISEVLLTVTDEKMYESILNIIMYVVESEYGMFGYFAKNGSFVVPAVTRKIYWDQCNVPEKDIIFEQGAFGGIFGRAMKEARTLINNAGPFDTPRGHVPIKNTMVTPIIFRGEIISAIHLSNKFSRYDEKDRAILEMISAQLAPVLQARIQRDRQKEERKRIHEELRISKNEYQDLYDNAPDMFLSVDAKTAKIQKCNQSLCSATGYREEEIIGRPIFDLYHPDCLEKVKKVFDTFVVSGQVHNAGLQIKRKDGTKIDISLNVSAVRDEQGNILHSRSVLRDITKRKQAEEEMRKLALAIEHSNELFSLASLDGMITYLNKKGAKMLGLDAEEIKNTNIMDVIPDHLVGLVERELLPALKRGEVWEGDLQYLNLKTGGCTDVHAMTFTIKENTTGKPQFLANVSQDITERKLAEEEKKKLETQLRQAQKMEAIGTLAGGIAHDFNNTLAGIMGYTELSLLQNQENRLLHSNLEKIIKATERGKALVQQILTFARPSGQERKLIDIRLELAEIKKFLRATLPANIQIQYNLQITSGTISADPIQIQQILMNLCFNAAHAMNEKDGVLKINLTEKNLDQKEIAIYPELKPGAYIGLTISDTGHGIDHEDIDRIFDPFFTTKEPGEGTGMGLAVVHGIVKNHDGAIRVKSEPGKGSTFQIYLPKVEEESIAITDIFKPVSKATKEACILLVDDEEDLITTGKQMLELLGYKVIARTSSKKALETFRAHRDKIDLVISDMTMPEMTGMALSKELLQIRPNLPIIICTGFSERLNPKQAKEIGIREMLMKPLSVNEVTKTIEKILTRD